MIYILFIFRCHSEHKFVTDVQRCTLSEEVSLRKYDKETTA